MNEEVLRWIRYMIKKIYPKLYKDIVKKVRIWSYLKRMKRGRYYERRFNGGKRNGA